MIDDHALVTEKAHEVAAAIAARDASALTRLLAPDFVMRRPGWGPPMTRAMFIAGVEQIPAEIVFVRLEDVELDVVRDGALVTGIQHSQVRVDGKTFAERRPFTDWFVRSGPGQWVLQGAVEIAPL